MAAKSAATARRFSVEYRLAKTNKARKLPNGQTPGVHTHPKAVRPDGARRMALRRHASASDALAKAQRCTRRLQSFALPAAQPLHSPPPRPLRYPPPQPLHCRKSILCAFASATFAFPRVHPCAHAAPYGHARQGICGHETAKSTSPNALQPLFSGVRRVPALKKWVNSSRCPIGALCYP